MAGNGPPPKDPSKRARANKDVVPLRTVVVTPTSQPELPTRYRPRTDEDGENWRDEIDWPLETVKWWRMWGDSPLAADFTETDWSELLIAAYLHAEFMEGNYKLAGELRLRTAKFGSTPEDRLRLRIQFAEATGAEVDTAVKVTNARNRFRGMKVAPDEIESA